MLHVAYMFMYIYLTVLSLTDLVLVFPETLPPLSICICKHCSFLVQVTWYGQRMPGTSCLDSRSVLQFVVIDFEKMKKFPLHLWAFCCPLGKQG